MGPINTLFLTQADLSTAAGLSLTITTEILASLVAAGAVETIYGGLKIIDPVILEGELTSRSV